MRSGCPATPVMRRSHPVGQLPIASHLWLAGVEAPCHPLAPLFHELHELLDPLVHLPFDL